MERRCIDDHGKPLCGAPPVGALLVELAIDSSCTPCLLRYRHKPDSKAKLIESMTTLAELGKRKLEHRASLRTWIDLDGYFRVEIQQVGDQPRYGMSRNFPDAVNAAFEALAGRCAIVSK